MAYCIDTSALIDAWVRWYPKDVFPTLWDRFEGLLQAGELVAPDEVLEELRQKEGDTLTAWALVHKHMFKVTDTNLQETAGEILNRFPRLVDPNSSVTEADPFVIALAQTMNTTVVTGEKATGQLETHPHIPDVCRHYAIKCINILEFIREQGWVFR